MANWTPHGFTAKMFALTARYVPPPKGIPPPVLWGDEAVARERLGTYASGVTTTRREIQMEFPFSPAGVVQLFRDYFEPTQVRLLPHAWTRPDRLRMLRTWKSCGVNITSWTMAATMVVNEYLEVLATRS